MTVLKDIELVVGYRREEGMSRPTYNATLLDCVSGVPLLQHCNDSEPTCQNESRTLLPFKSRKRQGVGDCRCHGGKFRHPLEC